LFVILSYLMKKSTANPQNTTFLSKLEQVTQQIFMYLYLLYFINLT